MNETGMSRGGTIRTSQNPKKSRTFRSGPYLNELFARAGRMDERLQEEICARIREARIESGMTLEEMADALGVTQRAYWNYEHNRVPFRRLREIAELTGVTQGWLLHGKSENHSSEALSQATESLRQLQEQLTSGLALTQSNHALLEDIGEAAARLANGQAMILDRIAHLEQIAARLLPPGAVDELQSNGS